MRNETIALTQTSANHFSIEKVLDHHPKWMVVASWCTINFQVQHFPFDFRWYRLPDISGDLEYNSVSTTLFISMLNAFHSGCTKFLKAVHSGNLYGSELTVPICSVPRRNFSLFVYTKTFEGRLTRLNFGEPLFVFSGDFVARGKPITSNFWTCRVRMCRRKLPWLNLPTCTYPQPASAMHLNCCPSSLFATTFNTFSLIEPKRPILDVFKIRDYHNRWQFLVNYSHIPENALTCIEHKLMHGEQSEHTKKISNNTWEKMSRNEMNPERV